VAKLCHPVLDFDDSEVALGMSETGGSCGKWVDLDGKPLVEISSTNPVSRLPKKYDKHLL